MVGKWATLFKDAPVTFDSLVDEHGILENGESIGCGCPAGHLASAETAEQVTGKVLQGIGHDLGLEEMEIARCFPFVACECNEHSIMESHACVSVHGWV